MNLKAPDRILNYIAGSLQAPIDGKYMPNINPATGSAYSETPDSNEKDVAEAIGPDCEKKTVGIRPGEKLHEEMITPSDSFYTYDVGRYYTILPSNPRWDLEEYKEKFKARKVPPGFKYNSEENTEWETVESLRCLIKEHVDKNFSLSQ